MLKTYLQENNISIYALSKKSGVAYTTVNDLANGRVSARNCRAGAVKDIADALGISIEELFLLDGENAVLEMYGKTYDIHIYALSKVFYSEFQLNGELQQFRFFKINALNARYAKDVAVAKAKIIIEQDMAERKWEAYVKGEERLVYGK